MHQANYEGIYCPCVIDGDKQFSRTCCDRTSDINFKIKEEGLDKRKTFVDQG